jgi:hypothetical protein
VVSFTPRPLYPPGKESPYPLDRWLGDPIAGLDNVVNRKFLTLAGMEPVEGSCEGGNEPSGSIKRWEVLEWLHNRQLLKKGSAP